MKQVKTIFIISLIFVTTSIFAEGGGIGTGGGGTIKAISSSKDFLSGEVGGGESLQLASIINTSNKYFEVKKDMISNIQLINGQIIDSPEEINNLNDTTKNDKFIRIKKNSDEIFDILLTSGKVCTIKENYCY